ncbi:MAG TPA: imidazole glycerol phosphate synthase subunit HisH [Bacillales bacterium]|nr:imidazole glycerol phosphate synthase subunit HisH [Bacillales bacterium]
MIGVIDYGMGNLHSVSKALERLDQPYFVSGHPSELDRAEGLILPGVGSFRDAMQILSSAGLEEFLRSAAGRGKPILGICLGMQLLFTESEENGPTKGLDFLPGRCVKFSGMSEQGERYKVPHMGWNRLQFHRPNHPLLAGMREDFAYFVHSYVVRADHTRDVLASCHYNGPVPAVVGRGNVFGTQFHPEKSSTLGMALLRNYCAFVERRGCDEPVHDLSGD